MNDHQSKADATRVAVDKFLADAGIAYSAKFVPQSISRNRREPERLSLNWICVFSRTLGNPATMSIEYMQGIGRIPGYNRTKLRAVVKAMDDAAETGVYPSNPPNVFSKLKPLPHPTAIDVIHCIISDARAASSSFDEWCSECGYDMDSRKALATYDACIKIAREARTVFGPGGLQELSELLRDY